MPRLQQKKIFFLKIDLPALLAVILFALLIFFYLIPGFEKAMMERKRILLHEMTSSAYSLLEYFHSLESKGVLNPDTAKQEALTAIGTIRYGETQKDYFWITDLYPKMVMHPYRTDLNGKDLTDFRDSRGKTIFVDFVKAASGSGESYVEYMWQWNDDSTRVVPKLSYVRIFRPWGWIIGTGIYIDDVRSEIRRTEFRALIISGIIGLVITVILLTISRQSHRIELRRNRAEEELRKSRELYRTLAEAASEGVLIWSSLGIRANKTLLSLIEFSEQELQNKMPDEIFDCTITREFHNAEDLYEELNTRWYSEGMIKSKSGNLIKSHSDFSRILLGEQKAVLIVIRPVKNIVATPDFSPEVNLLKNISTGFFRVTFGKKNRFVSATERTIKLLGFNTLQELLPHHIDAFFADPESLNSIRASLSEKKNVYEKEVVLKRITGEEFHALINVVVVETGSQGIWCEGSIEELTASASVNTSTFTDLSTFSASFIMEAPVSTIMSPAFKCQENSHVSSCLSLMKQENISAVIINGGGEIPLGILDAASAGIRLAEGGSADTEAFRWMSSPPTLIRNDSPISEAFSLIINSPGKTLVVIDPENRICGVVTLDELSGSFFTAPEIILSGIKNATSSTELHNLYICNRRLAVSMIVGKADPYAVSLYLASIADAICCRIIDLCLKDSGKPPCRFAFIHTGSAGRREQTFLTDQDNGIIFEDIPEERLDEVSGYFVSLGRKINEMLDKAGYKICSGGNMAGNPEWCKSLTVWKSYFSNWIKMPGPDEIMKTSIFFDFRYCYGESGLVDDLRNHVRNNLSTNDIYFHHIALAWKQFMPSASLISSGNTNIKKLLMPLTGLIRLYALKNGLAGISTPERITELYSDNQLDTQLLRKILEAWKDLSSIRFSHQTSCIINEREPDNTVDFTLEDYDRRLFALKAVSSINDLMLKAGTDFYTEIL
jgi:signal-transduction protein with cAMP-binding, CBS, and nucleotidyltransferase domain/PAS domain-containing protein